MKKKQRRKLEERQVKRIAALYVFAMVLYIGLVVAAHKLSKPPPAQQTPVVTQKNKPEPETKRTNLPAPKILSIKVED